MNTGTKNYSSHVQIERARPGDLWKIFEKYASVDLGGEKYMTPEDFVQKFLGLLNTPDYNPKSVALLAGILDTSKDNLISFPEFLAFERRLCFPDALYNTAFKLFDTSGNGEVSLEEFEQIITETTLHKELPFDLNGNFIKLYFGAKKDQVVPYIVFTQFIHDYHEEYIMEGFRRFDKAKAGFISISEFSHIVSTVRSHLLTEYVAQNLEPLAKVFCPSGQVSYPFFVAFNSVLRNTELLKKIYLQASEGSRDRGVTKEEFLLAAQLMSQITPFQVDILFQLCDLIKKESKIVYSDLVLISPEQYYKHVSRRIIDIKAVENPEDRNLFIEFLESFYRFVLGSAAGAVGATSVYPMDLVKTRMQNQRTPNLIYTNTWQCFKRSYFKEGSLGMYRGIFPQLLGVSFGKAIKLTVNDYLRDQLMNHKGQITLWGEVLAGACAGAANVLITSPLELLKIRIQVGGEVGKKINSMYVFKDVGFFGLYKGVTACFWRDVPFAAIFFPLYAHAKTQFQDENGYNSPLSLLLAGAVASIPASPLSVPFDVLKTRLQVKPRPGQVVYKGLTHATNVICKEEGVKALWAGARRVVHPSTQFGVTLLMYEILQRMFYVEFGGTRPAGSEAKIVVTGLSQIKSLNPDHIGGFAVALPVISGIESKFGLVLPKFRSCS